MLLMRLGFAALFCGLMSVPALADDVPLASISAVAMTDLNRLGSELQLLIGRVEAAQQLAAYWEDACRSTPGCDKPQAK